ncbi:MAG: hypothetical protein WC953_13105 [Pseudomonas sp.]
MTLSSKLGFMVFLLLFAAMILFVVVGQLTVRRLRKNPEVRGALGTELSSGWDILNVAGALSRPKWFSKMMRRSPLSFMAADERVLYKHTNIIERILARLFFWSWAISGVSFILLGALDMLGWID